MTSDESGRSQNLPPKGTLNDETAHDPVETTLNDLSSGNSVSDLERRLQELKTPAHHLPHPTASPNPEEPVTDRHDDITLSDEKRLLPDVPNYRSESHGSDSGEQHMATDEDLSRRLDALRNDAAPAPSGTPPLSAQAEGAHSPLPGQQADQPTNGVSTGSLPPSSRPRNNHSASGTVLASTPIGQSPSPTPNGSQPGTPTPAAYTPASPQAANLEALEKKESSAKELAKLFEDMLAILEMAKKDAIAANHPLPPNAFSFLSSLFVDAIDICNGHANTAKAELEKAKNAAPQLQKDAENARHLASLASGVQRPTPSLRLPGAQPRPRLQPGQATLSRELNLITDPVYRQRVAEAAERAKQVKNLGLSGTGENRTSNLYELRLRAREQFREEPSVTDTRLAKHRKDTDNLKAQRLADLETVVEAVKTRNLTQAEQKEFDALRNETGSSEGNWRATKQIQLVKDRIQVERNTIESAKSDGLSIQQQAVGAQYDADTALRLSELQYTITAANRQIESYQQLIKNIERVFDQPEIKKPNDFIIRDLGASKTETTQGQELHALSSDKAPSTTAPPRASENVHADMQAYVKDVEKRMRRVLTEEISDSKMPLGSSGIQGRKMLAERIRKEASNNLGRMIHAEQHAMANIPEADLTEAEAEVQTQALADRKDREKNLYDADDAIWRIDIDAILAANESENKNSLNNAPADNSSTNQQTGGAAPAKSQPPTNQGDNALSSLQPPLPTLGDKPKANGVPKAYRDDTSKGVPTEMLAAFERAGNFFQSQAEIYRQQAEPSKKRTAELEEYLAEQKVEIAKVQAATKELERIGPHLTANAFGGRPAMPTPTPKAQPRQWRLFGRRNKP